MAGGAAGDQPAGQCSGAGGAPTQAASARLAPCTTSRSTGSPVTTSIKCHSDRPSRSSRHTTSVSRAAAALRTSSSYGRRSNAPDARSVQTFQPPVVISSSTCRSGFCSVVDTRAYPNSAPGRTVPQTSDSAWSRDMDYRHELRYTSSHRHTLRSAAIALATDPTVGLAQKRAIAAQQTLLKGTVPASSRWSRHAEPGLGLGADRAASAPIADPRTRGRGARQPEAGP